MAPATTVGRVIACALAVLLPAPLAAGPAPARPPPAAAAAWVAVDTVRGSGLAASTETWEATPVDADVDSDQDLWIGYHDQGGRLWSNDGTGRYTLAHAWPRRSPNGRVPDRHDCDWADVDLDGRPDAYCAAGRSGANAVKTGQANELWRQTAPGTFTDTATAWGVGDECGRSHYVAFLRADADDYPDVFVGEANPRAVADPCDDPANGLPDEQMKLYLDQSGTGYRQVAPAWGITGYGGTRCAEVADVDGDGLDDLLVCGSRTTTLYQHAATSGFTDVSAVNGLTVDHNDAAFGDLDRDGDPDLVTALWGRVEYRLNTGGRLGPPVRMYAVPQGGGARAVALGDADGDGDLDVYVLVANTTASTNPRDAVLRNAGLRFTAVPVPPAGGVGDTVTALDGNGDGRTEFLVLNGVETTGPVQRIELRLQ